MAKRKDRDARGLFVTGHSAPGPGNPKLRKVAAWRRAIDAAINAEDVHAVIRKLFELALEGDVCAARELLDRGIGKPNREAIKLDSLDLGISEPISAESLARASARLLIATQEGHLSTQEAEALGSLLEGARRSLELNELAQRVAKLERAATAKEKGYECE